METSSNHTIVKNTLFLYLRMFLLMIIGLYTSRVLLATLGVVDFGLYNVIGSVIILTNVLTGSLSSAAVRYISYYNETRNIEEQKQLFGNILFIYILLAVVVLLFGETIGLWLVQEKLVIPSDRFYACMWVYQLSIFAAIVNVISMPYNSIIIAHERMSAFAYITIADVILKLLIVYIVMYVSYDKLIVYAILILFIQLLDRLFYGVYCVRNFEEVNVKPAYDKELFRKIFSFSGWVILGALGFVGYTQGLNILLNMFFGPTVNAARAISVQVETKAKSFTENFQVAVKPQVIKNYASGNLQRVKELVFISSKFSSYLVLAMALPVTLEAKQILSWWLVEVPNWTIEFVVITFCIIAIRVLAEPLFQVIHANGNIKTFQIIEGCVLLMILPVGYISLKFGHVSPLFPYYILLLFECIAQCIRMFFAFRYANIVVKDYLKDVMAPIMKVLTISLTLSIFLKAYLLSECSSIIEICLSLFFVLASSYLFGCSKSEKHRVQNRLKGMLGKFNISW